MDYVWTQIDRLVPENLRNGTGDERSVARLTVMIALLLAVNGPPYAVLYLWLGIPTTAMQVCVATIVVGGAIWPQRWLESSRIAANQVLLGLAWILSAVALSTGGHTSPALVWMTLIPAMAVMLRGAKAALGWALGSASIVAAFGIFFMLGVEPESKLNASYEGIFFVSTAPIVLMLQFAAVTAFDNVKPQMEKELEKARQQARSALDRARVVLDNVDQGLVLLHRDGRLDGEHSAAMEAWF